MAADSGSANAAAAMTDMNLARMANIPDRRYVNYYIMARRIRVALATIGCVVLLDVNWKVFARAAGASGL